MKPEVPISIEQFSTQNLDRTRPILGSESLKVPEKSVEAVFGGLEKKVELGSMVGDVGITTVLPQPVIDTSIVVKDTTVTTSPVIAADDDLIEKEWVDKAKKIVSENKDDPYQQESEVSRLQIDYLTKRFGRKIGASDK